MTWIGSGKNEKERKRKGKGKERKGKGKERREWVCRRDRLPYPVGVCVSRNKLPYPFSFSHPGEILPVGSVERHIKGGVVVQSGGAICHVTRGKYTFGEPGSLGRPPNCG